MGGNLSEEHPLAGSELSQLLDQVLILLGESVNTCSYVRGFNILMISVNDKKKVKMIKQNSQAFIDESNSNMLNRIRICCLVQNSRKL